MPRSPKMPSAAPASTSGYDVTAWSAHGVSTSEVAADFIRKLIFAGELHQDEHIRQEDIADRLGISRSPVREAVIALSHEGWLITEPHRGAFVRALDESSVNDHYEVLAFAYGLTARRATEHQTPDGLSALAAAQKALRKAETPEDVARANAAFLRQLFGVADASRLTTLVRSLGRHVVPGNFFEIVPGSAAAQKKGTALVVKHMRAGDAAAAEAACRDLMLSQGQRVIALLASRRLIQHD